MVFLSLLFVFFSITHAYNRLFVCFGRIVLFCRCSFVLFFSFNKELRGKRKLSYEGQFFLVKTCRGTRELTWEETRRHGNHYDWTYFHCWDHWRSWRNRSTTFIAELKWESVVRWSVCWLSDGSKNIIEIIRRRRWWRRHFRFYRTFSFGCWRGLNQKPFILCIVFQTKFHFIIIA